MAACGDLCHAFVLSVGFALQGVVEGVLCRRDLPADCMQNACGRSTASPVATLQILDLPDPLHQLLQQRARQNHRSLRQQALSDLQQACGGNPRERRRQALADLDALVNEQGRRRFDPSPEDLIRQDRSR